MMYAIGLDIGTTTVCGIMINSASGEVLKTITEKNDSFIQGKSFEKIQDPQIILNKVLSILDCFLAEHSAIDCIGVTGQMHGIVYLDINGNAVSPLYTWQDESGYQLYDNDLTYAQALFHYTGYQMSSGFGLTTFFYHHKNNIIPDNAVTFCTIHDFIAMKLAGKTSPILHISDSASLGLYNMEKKEFDLAAMKKALLPIEFLPPIGNDKTILGDFHGIPVSLAIGDNQASYIGSVCNMNNCLLINVGTGSQISLVKQQQNSNQMETRPCLDHVNLLVGSSLCGGRAFSSLEQFFRQVAEMVTQEPCATAYKGMDKVLDQLSDINTDLVVNTQFCGTRNDPNARGFIQGLSLNNFTPKDMMLGMLHGIVDELFLIYKNANDDHLQSYEHLIGSGNGIRQNKTLQQIVSAKFHKPLKIPVHKEEAAFGSILYALTAIGTFTSIEQAQEMIRYID